MVTENGFEVIECAGFSCIKYIDDFWFTQKTISHITKTTTDNVSLHLLNIYKFKNGNEGCLIFPIINAEGTRDIRRNCKHYNISNLYDVAIRSKRFNEINGALDEIKKRNKVNFNFRVSPIQERNFKEILEKALNGVEEFYYQYTILKYKVDFFFPRLKLIVEFDEFYHKGQSTKDTGRQNTISQETGYRFIRVDEGTELEGLNSILLFREHCLHNTSLIQNHQ